MFILRSSNGAVNYLLNDKEYVVGRRHGDILIPNDQSVSRRHAVLTVKNGRVSVTDCNSTYHTFVDNVQLVPNQPLLLKDNCSIKFGGLQSDYTLEEFPIVISSSGIDPESKKQLEEIISYLNGIFLPNWTEKCTHLTVEKFQLTAKVLTAIIEGKPVVSLKFWETFKERVENNQSLPDVKKFKVAGSDTVLGANVSIDYDPRRTSIFNGKIFVFSSSAEKIRMESLILLAGGKALAYDTNRITVNEIKNSSEEYIILQAAEESIGKDILDYLKSVKKRTIPFQEIALAIVYCSCEKNCNSSFDKIGQVFDRESSTSKTQAVFAPETQTQEVVKEIKEEIIIPETFDRIRSIKPESVKTEPTIKRKAEKLETNESDGDGVRKKSKSNSSNPMELQTSVPSTSTSVRNPFADFRKTKAQDSLHEIPAKKKKILTSTPAKQEEQPSCSVSEIFPDCSKNVECDSTIKNTKPQTLSKLVGKIPLLDYFREDEKEEISHFINSFHSCVVIERDDLEVKRPREQTRQCPNKNNFKKFKKVQPLHWQSRIIPSSEFSAVVCNKTADVVHPPDSDDSGVEEIEVPVNTNSKGRKYVF